MLSAVHVALGPYPRHAPSHTHAPLLTLVTAAPSPYPISCARDFPFCPRSWKERTHAHSKSHSLASMVPLFYRHARQRLRGLPVDIRRRALAMATAHRRLHVATIERHDRTRAQACYHVRRSRRRHASTQCALRSLAPALLLRPVRLSRGRRGFSFCPRSGVAGFTRSLPPRGYPSSLASGVTP